MYDGDFNPFGSGSTIGTLCKSVSVTTNIVNGKSITKKVTTIRKQNGTIEKIVEQSDDNRNDNKRGKIK